MALSAHTAREEVGLVRKQLLERMIQTDNLSHRERLFLRLVKLSVSDGGALEERPSPAEWEFIFSEARRQALTGVLFATVERLPAEERPPRQVLLQWYALAERIRQTNAVLDKEAVKVVRFLEEKGMPAVLLKGQGVARLYPDPSLRQSGDIDVWVMAKREKTMNLARSFDKNAPETLLHTELAVSDKAMVEAHFMPSFSYNPFRHRAMQRLFSQFKDDALGNKIKLGAEGGEVAVPTLAMNRVYLLVHLYRHFFDEGVGLRQLMDYYFCLRQGFTESEAEETRICIERIGMTRFAQAVFWLLVEVWNLPQSCCFLQPAPKQGKRLLAEVLEAGNFGHERLGQKRNSHEGKAGKFCRKTLRNWHFLIDYPGEVVFDVPFRLCHYIWRIAKRR